LSGEKPPRGRTASNVRKLRLEGIVSKRLDRPYVPGPTRDWIKVDCAAWKEANR